MDQRTRPSIPALVALAMLAVVLLTVMTRTNPNGFFDADPRQTDATVASAELGPVALIWIDVLLTAMAGVALWVHARAGGRIVRWALALGAIGAGVCAYHMTQNGDDLHRGATWIAAFAVAIAMMHLAQHDEARRWIVAALISLAAVYCIDAIAYVTYEQPMTIEHFRRNMDQILRARGIDAGSPHAELYIRRMESPDAVGPVGLSNVFGSLVGAIAMLAIAAAAGPIRRHQWRVGWPMLAAALAGLLTVLLTRSKGAAVTVMLCSGLLFVAWRKPRAASWLAMAMVAAAIGAVLLRGAMGPPDSWEGERSILFRFHYWQAAAAALADAPLAGKLLGLGVDDFSQAYLQFKNPLNPENVVSTHNVLIDLITMLGVGGMAWCVLLLLSLWRAAPVADEPHDDVQPQPLDAQLPAALTLTAVVFAGVAAVEGVALLAVESFLAFAFSAIMFVALITAMATPGWIDRRAAKLGLFAAAAMLLIHNQIEMTFFTDGAVFLAMLIVGSAAAKPGDMTAPRRAIVAPFGLIVIAAALAVWCAVPITRQQAALGRAEAVMREVDTARAERRHRIEQQMRQDGDPIVMLRAEASQWRGETTKVREWLTAAHDALPIDASPVYWQVRLLFEDALIFRQMRQPDAAEQAAMDALAVMDQSAPPNALTSMRLRARVFEFLADLLDAPDWRRDAAAIWSRVIQRSPYSLRDHLHLADLYWQLGDHDRARTLYEQCLTLHEQAYLDPATQLDADTLERVSERSKR